MGYLVAHMPVNRPTTGVPGGFGRVGMGDVSGTFKTALKKVMDGVRFIDRLSAEWPAGQNTFAPGPLLELISFCASANLAILQQVQKLRSAHFLLSDDLANIEAGLARRFDDLHVKTLIPQVKEAKARGEASVTLPPAFRDAMIRYWIEVKSAFFAIDHFKSQISQTLLGGTVSVFGDLFATFVVKFKGVFSFVKKILDKIPGLPDVGGFMNLLMWGTVAAGGLYLISKRKKTPQKEER